MKKLGIAVAILGSLFTVVNVFCADKGATRIKVNRDTFRNMAEQVQEQGAVIQSFAELAKKLEPLIAKLETVQESDAKASAAQYPSADDIARAVVQAQKQDSSERDTKELESAKADLQTKEAELKAANGSLQTKTQESEGLARRKQFWKKTTFMSGTLNLAAVLYLGQLNKETVLPYLSTMSEWSKRQGAFLLSGAWHLMSSYPLFAVSLASFGTCGVTYKNLKKFKFLWEEGRQNWTMGVSAALGVVSLAGQIYQLSNY